MSSVRLQCLSHTPLIGLVNPDETIEKAAMHAMNELNRDLQAFDPEVIFLFAPDHYNGFFYDLMPQFCVGIRASSIGDYALPKGALNVPEEIAHNCAEAVLADGVDIAISYRMNVDHGFSQPLALIAGSIQRYPVVPIFVNCVAPPLPTFTRARKLGAAVGKFAATLNKRVLFMGSGGMSHNPPIMPLKGASEEAAERLIAGRNLTPDERNARQAKTVAAARSFAAGTSDLHPLNPEWDRQFMNSLAAKEFDVLEKMTNAQVSEAAGNSAHELKTWVAANAALDAATEGRYQIEPGYYQAIPEWIAGFGTLQGYPR